MNSLLYFDTPTTGSVFSFFIPYLTHSCMLWSYAPYVKEQCSARSRAMLWWVGSIAFGRWEQCFWVVRSIAFGCWEHCFWMLGALLLGAGSIAFGLWEHCFWHHGVMLLELGKMKTAETRVWVPAVGRLFRMVRNVVNELTSP